VVIDQGWGEREDPCGGSTRCYAAPHKEQRGQGYGQNSPRCNGRVGQTAGTLVSHIDESIGSQSQVHGDAHGRCCFIWQRLSFSGSNEQLIQCADLVARRKGHACRNIVRHSDIQGASSVLQASLQKFWRATMRLGGTTLSHMRAEQESRWNCLSI